MRRLILSAILFALLGCSSSYFSDSGVEYTNKARGTDSEYNLLMSMSQDSIAGSGADQCIGTTKKGNRCLRRTTNTLCWQHEGQRDSAPSYSSPSNTSPTYTGPRGGQYHYSKSGKKVYEKKKK